MQKGTLGSIPRTEELDVYLARVAIKLEPRPRHPNEHGPEPRLARDALQAARAEDDQAFPDDNIYGLWEELEPLREARRKSVRILSTDTRPRWVLVQMPAPLRNSHTCSSCNTQA